jgi:hypothetical protein
VVAALILTSASATAAPSLRVDCHLDGEERTLRGTIELDLVNASGAALDRAYLWLYPNRFAEVPPALDDVSFYWVYPRRHDPGRMILSHVAVGPGAGRAVSPGRWRAEPHAAAGERVLWSIELPEPVAPGERLRLRASYSAIIPERYGSFGCVDGQCTLAGGFYPMPAALDPAGWDLLGPPLLADHDVSVSLARPASIVLFDQWSGNQTSALRVRATRARYATLVVAPRHHVSERRVFGASVRYLSTSAPPPADDASRVLLSYTQENYAAYALDTAERAFGLIAALAPDQKPVSLTMVEAPLRFELAAEHGRTLLVSDRFYRIWPAERFRKFHRRQLARAVFAHWLVRRGRLRGAVDGMPRDVAVDLVASWLTEMFVVQHYERAEFLRDILRPVSFVPVIDQLLYAPQTMFADAYFGDGGGGDTLRDDPRRFASDRPRGRFVYLKLRDVIGMAPLARALLAVMRGGAELGHALETAHRGSLAWFFRQWSLPPAPVNYRLVARRSRPRRDRKFDNLVVIERETAPGSEPPVEPVEVLAVDADGSEHRLRWSGRGQVGVLRYRSRAPVEWAWVDPDHRLLETSVSDPSQHALFDNRDSHRLRFVYNSFGVLLNVTDLSALLAADFSLSRVHDLKNQVRLVGFSSESVEFGGQVSYRRGFGREVTPDRLLGRAALTLGGARLNNSFFEEDEDAPGATQLSITASLGQDTEVFPFEPLGKHELRLFGGLNVTRRDSAMDASAEFLLSAEAGISTSRTVTPLAGHTLAGQAGIAAVFGELESRSQLLRAGGSGGVRGFGPGALFGRARATTRGEYRHTFVHDLDWNLGHYTYVRGFGGVLFGDVGLLSPCEQHLPERLGESLYASVGYGLQVLYDNFGTLPALMRIDAALRVAGSSRSCLGAPPAGGSAVQVYLSFLPPF